MKRIYEPLAYGDRPIRDRYWDSTVADPMPVYPPLEGDHDCDFAVIGGGYTGLSAALTLAEAGANVALLDAQAPGWGASGRNGGLVSTGSAKLADAAISKRYGEAEARMFFEAERATIELVEDYTRRYNLDIERQSKGYTYLAHNAGAVSSLQAYARQYADRYGMKAELVPKEEMARHGLNSPEFHGAVHLPLGFALNPMKFVLGLTRQAERAGVRLYSHTPVTAIAWQGRHILHTPQGRLRVRNLLVVTNGYSSDDLPPALASSYLPVQSNILVTRPMTEDEIQAQGWSSQQMVCDTRDLLHYFRLLPNNRMLFGLRGSVRVTEANLAATHARARRDFDRMFPAWRHVDSEYFWSGLICMTRNLVPFAGALPGMDNAWAALGYHGSGVAMAPYAGALIADMALGRSRLPHPDLMKRPLRRFELGPLRRWSLPPAFAWYGNKDGL